MVAEILTLVVESRILLYVFSLRAAYTSLSARSFLEGLLKEKKKNWR